MVSKEDPEQFSARSHLQAMHPCRCSCAVLARFGEANAVVLVAAVSSAATTWAEFVDAGSKVERYTGAVRALSQLVNWWKHLSEVENASADNISNLVLETEQAISKEQSNWMPRQSFARAEPHVSGSAHPKADAVRIEIKSRQETV